MSIRQSTSWKNWLGLGLVLSVMTLSWRGTGAVSAAQPALPPGAASASAFVSAPGQLDPTFNGTGKTSISFGPAEAQARGTVVQPDGKIVVVGETVTELGLDFAVTRYNSDGSLDTSFDGDGKVTTDFNKSRAGAYGVALQPDGKLVVVGYSSASGFGTPQFAVARYNSNGSLDPSFDSDGKVVTDLSFDTYYLNTRAVAVALQPDGKLVVVGLSYGNAEYQAHDVVLRYNSNGSLDASFNNGEPLVRSIGSTDAFASAVALQPDGKIVVAGQGGYKPALLRLNSNGFPDTSFGANGLLLDDFGVRLNAVVLQPDDQIVVAGDTNIAGAPSPVKSKFVVARYKSNGLRDSSFGANGVATTSFGAGEDFAAALALQADGKLVVAGRSRNGATDNFALARYQSDGSLDTSFDGDGKLTTALGTGADVAAAVALQANGKIVAAGRSHNGFANEFAVVCYNSNGSLDPTFDGDGKLTTAFSQAFAQFSAVALQPDGKLVAAGWGNFGFQTAFAVARFNSDGSLDPSFDGDGKLVTAFTSSEDIARAVAVQSDGKIIVAGFSNIGLQADFALARYNSDGSLDTSFDGDGKLTAKPLLDGSERAYAIAVQPDGKILVAGERNGKFLVARYNSNGSPDENFVGQDSFVGLGYVQTSFDSSDNLASVTARAIALQPDGKIVVVGDGDNFLAVARYNSNGSRDDSFDGDGRLSGFFGLNLNQANAVVLQPDGKLVIAGRVGGDFALARFNDNGSPDTSFDGDGLQTTDFGASSDVATGVALQASGKIVVAGFRQVGLNTNFALARYLPNGSLDSSWGTGGKSTVNFSGDDTAYALVIQPDSKVVAAGVGNNLASLARLEGNALPMLAPGLVATQQGAADKVENVAVASDDDDALDTLKLGISGDGVTFGSAATVNGVTLTLLDQNGAASGLNPNGSGKVSANISLTCAASTATFTLKASDSYATATISLTVTVALNTPPTLSYAPANLTMGASTTFAPATAADNGSITGYQILSVTPALNVAPTVNAAGVVAVNNASPLGNYAIVVRATDNCGATTNATLNLTVAAGPPVSLLVSAPSTVLVNSPFNFTVTAKDAFNNTATGYTGTVQFNSSDGLAVLPSSSSLSNGVGTFSATLKTLGTQTLLAADTISPTLAGGTSLTVTVCPTLTFAPAALPSAQAGVAYNQTIAAQPAGTYTYSLLTGSLPPGLTLNANTGVLSGTTTATGTYSFTLQAVSTGNCSGTQNYSLVVGCPTVTLTPSTLPGGSVSTAYSQNLSATPSGNYSFAKTSGTLPPGLNLSATGILSGTPTTSGTYTFTVTATAFGACTGSQSYTVTISANCATITLPALSATGTVNVNYTGNLAATTPSASYTFTVESGALPPGLVLDNLFAQLRGKPTAAGTYNFTLKATRSNGCTGTRAYTVVISGGALVALARTADYDGDGKSDLTLWSGARGSWQILRSSDEQTQTPVWGGAGDVTLLGDYDGDGQTDLAVFRPANGTWYVQRSSDGAALVKAWGAATDVPVPGDYDGDGKTDLAVFRPAEGNWYVLRSSDEQYQIKAWGLGVAPYLDVPVPGDYDGDGKTDLAVFRRQTGTWLIQRSSDGQYLSKTWGGATDVPVAGDYDGDGKSDFAVWRGATGEWFVLRSSDGGYDIKVWGASSVGDVPASGDYDGDGQTDWVVWRAPEQTWYVLGSRDGALLRPMAAQASARPIPANP